MLQTSLRVRCRNQRCRCKLPIPTENDHKAFCTPYCYNQFYQWRCKVCEKPILKGRRRKQPDHCHSVGCRKNFRTYPEAFGYPYSQTVKQDQRSAHFTEAFLASGPYRAGIGMIRFAWMSTGYTPTAGCRDYLWYRRRLENQISAHDPGTDGRNARGGAQESD